MKYLDQIKRITELEEGIGTIETQISDYKEKIKALQELADPLNAEINDIYAFIAEDMSKDGVKKVENDYVSVSVAKARASVNVTNADAIPKDFIRVKEEVDKKALLKALESGGVSGAELKYDKPKPKIQWKQ